MNHVALPQSIRCAQGILANRNVIFLEIHPREGESLDEIVAALKSDGRETIIDPARGAVTVFGRSVAQLGF